MANCVLPVKNSRYLVIRLSASQNLDTPLLFAPSLSSSGREGNRTPVLVSTLSRVVSVECIVEEADVAPYRFRRYGFMLSSIETSS